MPSPHVRDIDASSLASKRFKSSRKKVSAYPDRMMSHRKGLSHFDSVIKEMRTWSDRLMSDVSEVDNVGQMVCIAAILDSIADEEDCGSFLLSETGEHQFRLQSIEIDNDILDSLVGLYGPDAPQLATTWLLEWLERCAPPIYWLGWRFGHIDICGKQGLGLKIEMNHVVYCFRARKTVGITLWDGPDLVNSTLIPIPPWSPS